MAATVSKNSTKCITILHTMGNDIRTYALDPMSEAISNAFKSLAHAFTSCARSLYQAGVTAKPYLVESASWCGHQVKEYIIHPARAMAYHTAVYVSHHKKELVANILAWGLILVFCGAIHGFKLVALPMSIGLGPGLIVGLAIGILAAKAFQHEKPEKGAMHTIERQFSKISPWARTVLIALAASVYIAACAVMPHGAGASAGLLMGVGFSFQVAKYNPNEKPPLTEEERLQELAKQNETQAQKIERLEKALVAVQANLAEIQHTQQETADAAAQASEALSKIRGSPPRYSAPTRPVSQ